MNKLIIVAGPTAVGKTSYAIRLASQLCTEIISCDSRQFYSELDIGVARPSPEQLSAVPHHFIACRSVLNPYNISEYEHDAMEVIQKLFAAHDTVVAVGGSGLYIDALRQGVSLMPDPTPQLRSYLQSLPLPEKRSLLCKYDTDYYSRVDLCNPVRLQRALEVCLTTGRPYSQVIAEHRPSPRPFEIEIRILQADSAQLRSTIDRRVDDMMAAGLVDEVRSILHLRDLPTLRTVGYRELFPYFDGEITLSQAVEQIKLNTWHYARKQITWLRRYQSLVHQSSFSIVHIPTSLPPVEN